MKIPVSVLFNKGLSGTIPTMNTSISRFPLSRNDWIVLLLFLTTTLGYAAFCYGYLHVPSPWLFRVALACPVGGLVAIALLWPLARRRSCATLPVATVLFLTVGIGTPIVKYSIDHGRLSSKHPFHLTANGLRDGVTYAICGIICSLYFKPRHAASEDSEGRADESKEP